MIDDFYGGETVLLTGVTGFLGKAVLEKLLRSCPAVKEVCVLVRPKRGVDVQRRLDDILLSPMFSRIKSENPGVLRKVRAISGDIEKDSLGMSEGDRIYLIHHISVVIHSAASVKFNDALLNALNTNYKGTARVLQLAREALHLKVFVYVSTAYSNCHREEVKEEVLKTECDIATLESMSSEVIDLVTPSVLQGRPNTYTYSKAAAECLLRDQKFPVAIVRPSIISATWKGPSPGFVDCFTGATGLMASVYKGLITHIVAHEELVIDIVPLDVVTNVVVASAWHASTNIERVGEPIVLHCCTGNVNPVTLGEFRDYWHEGATKYPLEGSIRSPRLTLVRNPVYYAIISFFLSVIPFLIVDSVTLLTGSKPKLLKMFWRVHDLCSVLQHFRTHQWSYERKNLTLMASRMSPKDRDTFYVDLENLNWRSYMHQCFFGVKNYIFKEDFKRIPIVRQQQKKMFLAEMGTYVVLLSVACLFIADILFNKQLLFIASPVTAFNGTMSY